MIGNLNSVENRNSLFKKEKGSETLKSKYGVLKVKVVILLLSYLELE